MLSVALDTLRLNLTNRLHLPKTVQVPKTAVWAFSKLLYNPGKRKTDNENWMKNQ